MHDIESIIDSKTIFGVDSTDLLALYIMLTNLSIPQIRKRKLSEAATVNNPNKMATSNNNNPYQQQNPAMPYNAAYQYSSTSYGPPYQYANSGQPGMTYNPYTNYQSMMNGNSNSSGNYPYAANGMQQQVPSSKNVYSNYNTQPYQMPSGDGGTYPYSYQSQPSYIYGNGQPVMDSDSVGSNQSYGSRPQTSQGNYGNDAVYMQQQYMYQQQQAQTQAQQPVQQSKQQTQRSNQVPTVDHSRMQQQQVPQSHFQQQQPVMQSQSQYSASGGNQNGSNYSGQFNNGMASSGAESKPSR